ISTFFLWGYVYLVGASPSLVRAVLMLTLASLCKLQGIPMDTLNILAATFMVHLLWVPADGRSLAFMLSYLALVGLLVLAPRWNYLLRPRISPFLLNALTASMGAFLMTAPVVIASFGVLYPVGIMISPIVGFFVMVFMVGALGFLLGILLFPFLSFFFQRALELLYTLILGLLKMATYFPAVTVMSGKIEAGGLVLFATLAISLLLVYGESRGIKRGIPRAFDHL
ncbi:MAG: ComEC/Rec2 family competence protein, partial [Breznakiellaceae bacterium]